MPYYRIRKVNNSETVRRKAEDYIGKIVVIESAVSAESIDKYVRPYVTETPSSGEHCVCKRAG